MKSLFLVSLLALSLPLMAADEAKDGWISLFNGKDLNDWQASDEPGTFSVEGGELVVHGPRSHLFYMGPVNNHDFKNFELKCEIMTKPGANSGVYFHTAFQPKGWPDKGFEVQVNNSHKDTKRTAGLYDVQDNFVPPSPDNVWFTMYIKVEGNHVITKVNDKVITDWTQPADFKSPKGHPARIIDHGTIAIQGHDPGSETHYKSIVIHPLP